jgi:UPF0271 protein
VSGLTVDLNADMGESFGRYRLHDAALFESVTSASIACGFHAGDPVTMREAVAAAQQHGVVIGAHPGYPDLAGFGRREMALTPSEIEAIVVYQVGALQGVCASVGARLRYVKAHGALYNRAARDPAAADALVRAIRSVDGSLALLALAGSTMIAAAEKQGIRAVSEVFVDRAYRGDGSLVPRSEAGAVLDGVDAVAERALRMVETGTVEAADGSVLRLRAESLCTHGDGEHAAEMVRTVRRRLEERGIVVAPFMDG